MIATLVGLALFADAENYAGTFDASNRTELRPRYTENDRQSPALDFLDVATARLGLSDRRWEHFISYTPVLTIPYLFDANLSPLLLHAASVGTSWHDRRVRLSLTEDANYGQENVTLLSSVSALSPTGTGTGSAGQAPAAQVAATPATLSFGLSRTALYTDLQFEPRLRGTMLLSYTLQKGLDDESLKLFPFQKGPRAEVTVDWSASRIDIAETRVVGQISDSTKGICPVTVTGLPLNAVPPDNCDPAVQFVFATEGWRHRFATDLEGAIGVGATYVNTRLHSTDPYTAKYWPVAEAWLERSEGIKEKRRSIRVDADLEPVVDVRTGAADYRATLTGLSTTPFGDKALRLQVWGVQSIDSVVLSKLTLIRGEAEVEHFLTPWFSYGVGARVEWEHQDPFGSLYTLLAFGQATFRVPTVRF